MSHTVHIPLRLSDDEFNLLLWFSQAKRFVYKVETLCTFSVCSFLLRIPEI